VADRADLELALERELPSRDSRRLHDAAKLMVADLEPKEQILKLVAGTWFRGNRCLLVATSRRVLASDGDRLDSVSYRSLLTVDYNEGWRKAHIMIRGQGAVADVRDIHLDAARELKKVIDTARRAVSTPGMDIPGDDA
jgi:hypothetical protein